MGLRLVVPLRSIGPSVREFVGHPSVVLCAIWRVRIRECEPYAADGGVLLPVFGEFPGPLRVVPCDLAIGPICLVTNHGDGLYVEFAILRLSSAGGLVAD